jgi:DNA-binding MarR family transcriptional regulator
MARSKGGQAAELGPNDGTAVEAAPKKRPAKRQPRNSLPPRQSVGYLVREAHRAFMRSLEPKLAPHGISSGAWFFLRLLWIQDGLTQTELSEAVKVKEPTTVRALDRMQRMGLIERRKVEGDKRKLHVFLTAKAVELRDRTLPLAVEVNVAATRHLTDDERVQLCVLLQKVTDALDAEDSEAVAASRSHRMPTEELD